MAVAGEACVSGVTPELQALAFPELDQEWRAMPCLVNDIIVGYNSVYFHFIMSMLSKPGQTLYIYLSLQQEVRKHWKLNVAEFRGNSFPGWQCDSREMMARGR